MKPKILKRKELFNKYLELYPDSLISYKDYVDVLTVMNKKMVEFILNGETIKLGNNMGSIRIKKIQRSSSSVNWCETNKLKKKGINKFVYFTSDYWYRWFWNKKLCRVKNKSIYIFKPTKGPNGNTKKLHRKIVNEPYIENVYQQ